MSSIRSIARFSLFWGKPFACCISILGLAPVFASIGCSVLVDTDGLTGAEGKDGSVPDGGDSAAIDGSVDSSVDSSADSSVDSSADSNGDTPSDQANIGEDVIFVEAGDSNQDTGTEAAIDSSFQLDADGGLEAEASSVLCAKPHTFCDDFDFEPLSQKWTELVTVAGSVNKSTANSVSAPYSMFAQVNTNAGYYSSVGVYKMFSASGSYHIEFDLLVAVKSSLGGVEFISLDFNPPSGYQKYGIAFGLHDGLYMMSHWSTESGGAEATSHADLTMSTSFAVWRKVEIDVTLSSSGGMATLKLDGQVAGQLPLLAAPPLGLRLNLGGSYVYDIDKNWQIYADNVIVDAK